VLKWNGQESLYKWTSVWYISYSEWLNQWDALLLLLFNYAFEYITSNVWENKGRLELNESSYQINSLAWPNQSFTERYDKL
jgi:hypothetical protein